MLPGRKREVFIFTLLAFLFMLVCLQGCIQQTNPRSSSDPYITTVATPAPAGQGSVAPEPAQSTPHTAQVDGTVSQAYNPATGNPSTGAKYSAGSSVQKHPGDSSYDKDRGFVIVKVNGDGTYTVGQIYFDPGVRVWFKVSDEMVVTRVIHAVERDYPILKGTIDWNNFPTKHGVVDKYGTTKLEW